LGGLMSVPRIPSQILSFLLDAQKLKMLSA